MGGRLPIAGSKRSKKREKVEAALKGIKVDGRVPQVKANLHEVKTIAKKHGIEWSTATWSEAVWPPQFLPSRGSGGPFGAWRSCGIGARFGRGASCLQLAEGGQWYQRPFSVYRLLAESGAYFLMELVTGGDLEDVLQSGGPLNHHQALFCTGSFLPWKFFMESALRTWICMKCENCLLDQQGYLKIIDFGFAHQVTDTVVGPVNGTPQYMAPGMMMGQGLGVCLCRLVTWGVSVWK